MVFVECYVISAYLRVIVESKRRRLIYAPEDLILRHMRESGKK